MSESEQGPTENDPAPKTSSIDPMPTMPEPVSLDRPPVETVIPAPVEPEREPEPEPEPEPEQTGSTATAEDGGDDDWDDADDDDTDDDDDDWDEGTARDRQALRWVGMVSSLGTGIVAVVGIQVLMTIMEGLSLRPGERFAAGNGGLPDDLFHRIGYPFTGVGSTALLLLIVAIVLITLPPVLGGRLTSSQYRNAGLALRVATVLAVVIAIGSLLAVRASLHLYTAQNAPVPPYIRVQFTNFMIGTLAGSALAVFGSMTGYHIRDWDR